MYGLWALLLTASTTGALALPALRVAPAKCPLENRNLLDVVLFVETDMECKETCRKDPKCVFYQFYEAGPQEIQKKKARSRDGADANYQSVENQPSQCFLYSACNREVLEATVDCPLTK